MHDRLMTYADLADFLGKSEEAARQFAKRRRWRRSISNEDGKAQVSVPVEFLEAPRPPVEPHADDEPDAERPADEAIGMVVTMLRERVECLEAELAAARNVLEAERVRAGQVEDLKAGCARWQAKADEALTALLERTAVVPRTDAPRPIVGHVVAVEAPRLI